MSFKRFTRAVAIIVVGGFAASSSACTTTEVFTYLGTIETQMPVSASGTFVDEMGERIIGEDEYEVVGTIEETLSYPILVGSDENQIDLGLAGYLEDAASEVGGDAVVRFDIEQIMEPGAFAPAPVSETPLRSLYKGFAWMGAFASAALFGHAQSEVEWANREWDDYLQDDYSMFDSRREYDRHLVTARVGQVLSAGVGAFCLGFLVYEMAVPMERPVEFLITGDIVSRNGGEN